MSEEKQEIKEFNPNDVIDNIKDHIKKTFIGLIPEENWKNMIKTTVDDYLNKFNHNNYTKCTHYVF